MTRKDYLSLAAALGGTRPELTAEPVFTAALEQWQRCVHAVSVVLAADNARFDRARFLANCGAPAEHNS